MVSIKACDARTFGQGGYVLLRCLQAVIISSSAAGCGLLDEGYKTCAYIREYTLLYHMPTCTPLSGRIVFCSMSTFH